MTHLVLTFAPQLGPIIGGVFSQPAQSFPSIFGESKFMKKYPYFLACAIPATFSVLAWIVTYLFLKETVVDPTPISEYLGFRKPKDVSVTNTADPNDGEITVVGQTITCQPSKRQSNDPRLPLKAILTPQVLLAAANYATLSLVDIAFRTIQPLFFSTPIHLGGLGLPPSTIGQLLAAFGVINGVFQAFYFAQIHDRWGSKNVFMWGLAGALPAFASFPIINLLAKHSGYSAALWAVVAFQIIISISLSVAYGKIQSPLNGSI